MAAGEMVIAGDTAIKGTIANAGTVSTAINISNAVTGGIQFPNTFAGTSVTFQVSYDGVTYVALNDSSGAVSMTMVQAKAYALPASVMAFPFFKVVSTAQAGDVVFHVTRKNA